MAAAEYTSRAHISNLSSSRHAKACDGWLNGEEINTGLLTYVAEPRARDDLCSLFSMLDEANSIAKSSRDVTSKIKI